MCICVYVFACVCVCVCLTKLIELNIQNDICCGSRLCLAASYNITL